VDAQQFDALFHAKSVRLLYGLGERDCGHGWVGGNAPAYFDAKPEAAREGETRYYFYMTLVSPVNGRMLSVFLPPFAVYNQRSVYPDCAIRVFEHEMSPESRLDLYRMFTPEPDVKKTSYEKSFDYTKPTLRKTFLTEPRIAEGDATEDSFFLQVGGHPFWVQYEPCNWKALEDEGRRFFFCIDEYGYPDGMIHGNAPFCWDMAYFYAIIANNDVSDVVAGFWQSS
jgi:hypothetical protein